MPTGLRVIADFDTFKAGEIVSDPSLVLQYRSLRYYFIPIELVDATTADVAPGQIGNLTAAARTTTSITVSYTAPSTGAAPITYSGSIAPPGSVTSDAFSATGGTFTGLAPGRAYTLSIIATNAAGAAAATLAGVVTLFTGNSVAGAVEVLDTLASTDATAALAANQGHALASMLATATAGYSHPLAVTTPGQTAFTLVDGVTNPQSVVLNINGVEYVSGAMFTVTGNILTWRNLFRLDSTDTISYTFI